MTEIPAPVIIYDHGLIYIAREILIFWEGHVYQVAEVEESRIDTSLLEPV
jgi:hypothetical protein